MCKISCDICGKETGEEKITKRKVETFYGESCQNSCQKCQDKLCNKCSRILEKGACVFCL